MSTYFETHTADEIIDKAWTFIPRGSRIQKMNSGILNMVWIMQLRRKAIRMLPNQELKEVTRISKSGTNVILLARGSF